MADSGITVSGLTATGGVGQIALGWSVTEASCLPYLRLDKVEIWEATANNRDTAVKVAEIFGAQYVRGGLGKSITRYYWVRARDASGNLGDFFPASATAGIAGTTTSNAPSPATVSDIVDNLGNINAGNINGVTITGSLLRTVATGMRIEISAAQNAINFYNASGQIVGQIRAIAGNTLASFIGNFGPAPVISAQNDGNGAAGRFSGSGNNPGVLDVENFDAGSNRNGARIQNSSSGGGSCLLGRASANGGHAAYAARGGFGPFTGQHDAFILKAEMFDLGDIMVDRRVLLRKGIDDTVTEVAVCSEREQMAVIGVASRRVPLLVEDAHSLDIAALSDDREERDAAQGWLCAEYDLVAINSVGEGQINVCGRGGDIAAGDLLITSSMRGKAERQGDQIVYSFTVAKAREEVTFTHPDEVRLVACTYHCG